MKRPGVPVPARGGLKEGMPAGRWRRRVLKRFWILIVVLALLPLSGCKKSEEVEIENFFGAPPEVSEVFLTKERMNFDCLSTEAFCFAMPYCYGVWEVGAAASIDLLTASAKVVDETPGTTMYPSDILVVVLRFLSPPPGVDPGATVQLFSLEMFDNGSATLATNVRSGDLLAGDGTFTRKFYFGTITSEGAGTCILDTDMASLGYTYSTFGAALDLAPSETVEYEFKVQAIDRAGNIATSTDYPLSIQGTYRDTVNDKIAECVVEPDGTCHYP